MLAAVNFIKQILSKEKENLPLSFLSEKSIMLLVNEKHCSA